MEFLCSGDKYILLFGNLLPLSIHEAEDLIFILEVELELLDGVQAMGVLGKPEFDPFVVVYILELVPCWCWAWPLKRILMVLMIRRMGVSRGQICLFSVGLHWYNSILCSFWNSYRYLVIWAISAYLEVTIKKWVLLN